jgi:23S rRNA maturation-related 3'-5' exoribonuclease YhaM
MTDWLIQNKYFESPGSTKYHNSFRGGLALHSYGVYKLFSKYLKMLHSKNKAEITDDSAFLIAILHDVCKVGAYIGDSAPYKFNKDNGIGHSCLSVERIEKFIKLTQIEKEIILFHMGPYLTKEHILSSGWGLDEYTLKEMIDMFNKNKLTKLFYFCDDTCSNFFE